MTSERIVLVSLLALMLMAVAPGILDDWGGGVQRLQMCVAQANGAEGPCDSVGDGTGAEIVYRMAGRYTFTVYGTQSTATAYNCDVYSNDTGYDADAGDVQKMNTDSITHQNQVISFSGLMDYVWLQCDTITGGVIKATMLVAPLSPL